MLYNFDRVAENYDKLESDHLKILYYDLDKGYNDTYKSYNYYRLCTMLTGKKEVSINGEDSITYTPSEYILLPPNSSVDMSIGTHTKAVVYEIDNHLIDKISDIIEKPFFNSKKIEKHKYSVELFNSLKKLKLKMYHTNKEARFFMDLYVQELVYQLINTHGKNISSNIDTDHYNPAKAAEEIITKLGNEKLTIGEIAEMLNLSQSNLDYYFKKEYDITPKKYQVKMKIERSKYLLNEKNVTEVAMQLGFDNISHFIRLFKKEYKITPKQYKKSFLI